MANNNPYALRSISSAYISVPTIPLGSNWTIEGVIRFPIPSASGGCNTLTRGSNDHQIIFYNGISGTLELGMFDNTTSTSFHSTGYKLSSISNGWHRISCTGHDNIQEFYIDGIYIGQTNCQSKTNIVSIGNYQGGTQQIGDFDDVRIFNYAVSSKDIYANWNKVIPTSTTGLIAYYKCDEGTGTTVKDSLNKYNGVFSGSLTWITGGFDLYKIGYLIQDNDRVKQTIDATNLTDIGGIPITLDMFNNYGMQTVNKINNTVIGKITNNKYKIAMYKK